MMTRADRSLFSCKSFFCLILCTLLIAVLCMQQVQSTAAYMTSLSSTCVNLFTEKDSSDSSSQPPGSDASTPSTGDSSHMEWAVAIMLLSILAIIILSWRSYITVSSKKNNNWRIK